MKALETHLFGGALFSAGRGGSDERQPRGKTSRTLVAALVATGTLVFVSPAQADTLQVPRDFETIQAAIDAAVDFDHIIVAPGEYVENIDFSGKTITVRGAEGPDITTIAPNHDGAVVTCASGEGPGTVLHGFTIINGCAEEGGGMLTIGASVTVIDCVFDGNQAHYGGGCYSDFSDLVIIDTVFVDNYGLFGAFGGMFFDHGSLVMDRCEFLYNEAGYQAGALHLGPGSTSIVTNCLFNGNRAREKGFSYDGALQARGEATIANCTFVNNFSWNCDVMTIGADTHLSNCIIDDTDSGAICGDGTITYSLVTIGFEGEGNIESDPMFVDPDNDNFRLAAGSPAIDAGNNNAVPRGVERDLDGNPRFLDDFDVADTGVGRAPIVDMGAYEHAGLPPADLNNDGIVDGGDLLILLGSWGACVNCDFCLADLDGDCVVGPSDLIILLGSWGDTG